MSKSVIDQPRITAPQEGELHPLLTEGQSPLALTNSTHARKRRHVSNPQLQESIVKTVVANSLGDRP